MKRFFSILLIVILVLGTLSGCGVKKVEENTADKDTLVFSMASESTSLDPEYNGDVASQEITLNVFESLVREKSGAFVPAAAETWEVSDDGLTYTFHLFKDIKFQNGKDLTAEDVVYTYQRAAESPYAAELVECVKDVKAKDEYTVNINMLYPYGPFLSLAACPQLGIVDKETVEEAGDSFGRNPIGSGPYKFVDWVNGDEIVLEAYDGYHLGGDRIKNITFKFIADLSSAMIALEKGEIDVLKEPAPMDKQNIIDNKELVYYEVPALRSSYFTFNCEKEPFDNVLVRQAFAYVIDKESILSAAAEGNGQIAENHIAPSAFGYSDKAKKYEQDIEKAKELLNDAGYPDGFECTIMCSSDIHKKIASVMQADLAKIGIKAEIEIYEWATFLNLAQEGNFDVCPSGWGYLAPDADQGLYAIEHSSQIGGAKFDRYVNEDMDKYLEIGRTDSDQGARAKAYEDLLLLMHEECPTIPLFWQVSTLGANKNLEGVEANSMAFYYMADWSWN